MNNRFEYILASVFLLVVMLLTWYLFFYDDFVSESVERVTGIFTSLALGFGVFQLWIREINTDRRKLYELQYEAYKDIVLQIDSISETLDLELTGNEISSIHAQVSRLMNNANRIKSSIGMNSDFLFPGLHLKPETKSIVGVVDKILVRTDEFRLNFENAAKKDIVVSRDHQLFVERINWHNGIREYLQELHSRKYDFYRILSTYLRSSGGLYP
jgi:hypothetical protein